MRVVTEVVETWAEGQAYLRVLRDAGYHGQLVEAADGRVVVHVDGGKRGKPLDQRPAR